MTTEVALAVKLVGRHLAAEPYRLSLDVPGGEVGLSVPRAIYLAYTREATLHYVGKVERQAGTVGQRLREHTRTSASKRAVWRWLWVVPLATSVPEDEIRLVERALIRTFRPPGNVQHTKAA